MVETYKLGLNLFSSVTLFVGMFLIFNVFSMTVAERTREFGMQRAIGMLPWQIARQSLIEAVAIGITGFALGVAAGLLLAPGLIWIASLLLKQARDVAAVQVPPVDLAISIAVGTGATIIAALVPAWQASRVSPLEALRSRSRQGQGWLLRKGWPIGLGLMVAACATVFWLHLPPGILSWVGRAAVFVLLGAAVLLIPATFGTWERLARPVVYRLYGHEGNLGISNVARARLRSTLTVTALMVCIAMMIGLRGLSARSERDIQSWADAYLGGDLYVYAGLPMRVDLQQRLEAVAGIAAVTPVRYLQARVARPLSTAGAGQRSEPVTFAAVDPRTYGLVSSYIFADSTESTAATLVSLAEGDTVLVSSVLAERYTLHAGDRISLETRRGTHEFSIAAIVVDFYQAGEVVQGSWRDLRRYFGVNDVSVFYVKLDPLADRATVQDNIDRLYGERRHLTVQSNEVLKESIGRSNRQVFAMFDVLSMIGIIVAALGVLNTLMINVLERKQELGTLRCVGMTKRQISKMIVSEAAMLGAIGGAFGLLLGLALERVFLSATADISGLNVGFVLPVDAMLAGVGLALIVAQLTAVWPAHHATTLSIVDAIKWE